MYRNRYLSNIGATLAGRDALAAHGLMSFDDTFTWIESDVARGACGAIVFVARSEKPDIIDGRKYSPISKALVDYMEFPYDDSALTEALGALRPEEKRDLDRYIIKRNKLVLCRDERWREYFTDILEGHLNQEEKELKHSLTSTIENKKLAELLATMHRLHLLYPEGIKKQELLDMATDLRDGYFAHLTITDMENLFAQVKPTQQVNPFTEPSPCHKNNDANSEEEKGVRSTAHRDILMGFISGRLANKCISDFFSLMSGLTEESIPATHVFKDGYWLPPS